MDSFLTEVERDLVRKHALFQLHGKLQCLQDDGIPINKEGQDIALHEGIDLSLPIKENLKIIEKKINECRAKGGTPIKINGMDYFSNFEYNSKPILPKIAIYRTSLLPAYTDPPTEMHLFRFALTAFLQLEISTQNSTTILGSSFFPMQAK